jgi:integrase
MTAAAARRLALVAAAPATSGGDRVERVRALLRPGFLAEVWQADGQVFAPPREHPLLGLRKCAVIDCEAGVRTPNTDLCKLCVEKFKASGLAMGEFTAIPANKISKGEQLCRVPGCPRPAHLRVRCCQVHCTQWRQAGLSPEEFAASPAARPLASFGECLVLSCSRAACGTRGLCAPHRTRWKELQKQQPAADFRRWQRIAEPVNADHFVVFKGLAEQAQLELLLGLQLRTDAGVRTLVTALRPVVAVLRRTEAASVADLDESLIKQTRLDASVLGRHLMTAVQRATTTPDEERRKDVWDLAVLGLSRRLDFTPISQAWLREAAKRWAEEELPQHRGRQAAKTSMDTVSVVGQLSACLRETRQDHGVDPAALGRRDIIAFTNRLAHHERTGTISVKIRVRACRDARRFLTDIRAMGLTRPAGIAAGLPDDFIMGRQDIPSEPDPDEQGRDLPAWVLQILDANLHVLEERSGTDMRRMTELMMDTGRRPDEICQLRLDCLTRDAHGKPVLIYTDSKNHRPSRRLPVAEATARVIASQQADVRARFPAAAARDLPLFPRDRTNPDGRVTYSEPAFTSAHRQWVNSIAHLLVTTATGEDGQPHEQVFDRLAVIPYAYRHSYAQRHADEGVPPDVLRDLLGHDKIGTTLGYYRVSEKRVRVAIDRVSGHQFDSQGRRVFLDIRGLLADEHARMRVGQVAVPFGICTEPSNVKAGGQACPYKFTCLGCGHFRSDPSYLPELKSYLQQLLADREQVQAATELQDWAKAQVTPREEEIAQLRELIRRIEADVADLTEQDQALIADAVTVIRKTRQLVSLGMPSVRPAAKTG